MINEKLHILLVCDEYGIKLNHQHVGLCPLHSEKTPSFRVYPKTNSFYCFGCGAGGDSIKLKSLLTGVPEKTICQQLIAGTTFFETLKYDQIKSQNKKIEQFEAWHKTAFLKIIKMIRKYEDLSAAVTIDNMEDVWQYIEELVKYQMLLNNYDHCTPKYFYNNYGSEVDKIDL